MSLAYKIRPVNDGDAEGLIRLYQSFVTPHTPVNLEAVQATIAASKLGISDRAEFTQMYLVAEAIGNKDHGEIVGSAAMFKLGSDKEWPILWRQLDGGSFERFRYNKPALEFGAMRVLEKFRNEGVGNALTIARILIADRFSYLFSTSGIFVDFLPPLRDPHSKENAFWDVIVRVLEENGTFPKIMEFCNERSCNPITNTTELSTFIGNEMSDADRNIMIEKFFPDTFPRDLLTNEALQITKEVHRLSRSARKNLVKALGPNFQQIGAFPINGGPNYAIDTIPELQVVGPTELISTVNLVDLVAQTKMLIFAGLSAGFEGLQQFEAYYLRGAVAKEKPPKPIVHIDVATAMKLGQKVMFYCL